MAKQNKYNTSKIVSRVSIGLLIIVLLFLVLNNQSNNYQNEVTCNSPYIKVGTECCLDEDSNSICDSDEKTVSTNKLSSDDLVGKLKWIELTDVVASGSGVPESCPNGKNVGDIWLDFEIKNNPENENYLCKTNLIEGENTHLWSSQWTETINSRVAVGQHLKNQHTVQVCCSLQDNSGKEICNSFTLEPYC